MSSANAVLRRTHFLLLFSISNEYMCRTRAHTHTPQKQPLVQRLQNRRYEARIHIYEYGKWENVRDSD